MAKNIDVQGHVNRYIDTDPSEIRQLIKGLEELIPRQKELKKAKLRAELEAMEAEENGNPANAEASDAGVSDGAKLFVEEPLAPEEAEDANIPAPRGGRKR